MASPRLQPCRPGTRVHTCHTAGLVREAACAAGQRCVVYNCGSWPGQAPRETLAQQGAPCSACACHTGRQECRSLAGGEAGGPVFPVRNHTSRVGEGGRQDKLSRCVWPRAPVTQAVRAERSCRGSLDLSPRRLWEQFNPATCPSYHKQVSSVCQVIPATGNVLWSRIRNRKSCSSQPPPTPPTPPQPEWNPLQNLQP